MHTKITVFEVFFFAQNRFYRPNGRLLPRFILYIFWKLLFQPLIWHIWIPIMCILWSVLFCLTFWDWTGSISWNLVVNKNATWAHAWFLKFRASLVADTFVQLNLTFMAWKKRSSCFIVQLWGSNCIQLYKVSLQSNVPCCLSKAVGMQVKVC